MTTPDRPTSAAAPARNRVQRAWLLIALGLLAAVISLVVVDRTETVPLPAPLPPPDERGEADADVVMDGADIAQYRPDGTLQYRLRATQIRHFEADAFTALNAPDLSLHDADRAPWTASARSGTLRRTEPPAAEEVVSLRDAVVLEQSRADGDRVRLTTSAMDLYPARQYAETDQDVMIDSHIGRTTATGLEGDLQLGMLRFFSSRSARVHTVLLPEQFK